MMAVVGKVAAEWPYTISNKSVRSLLGSGEPRSSTFSMPKGGSEGVREGSDGRRRLPLRTLTPVMSLPAVLYISCARSQDKGDDKGVACDGAPPQKPGTVARLARPGTPGPFGSSWGRSYFGAREDMLHLGRKHAFYIPFFLVFLSNDQAHSECNT